MTEIRNKPGGRPAKNRINKYQKVVSTKLTELQFYAIRKRAGGAGLHVSEYVRQAVVSAEVTPRLNRQDADTIRRLAGEANNINQLAHRANAGGFANADGSYVLGFSRWPIICAGMNIVSGILR